MTDETKAPAPAEPEMPREGERWVVANMLGVGKYGREHECVIGTECDNGRWIVPIQLITGTLYSALSPGHHVMGRWCFIRRIVAAPDPYVGDPLSEILPNGKTWFDFKEWEGREYAKHRAALERAKLEQAKADLDRSSKGVREALRIWPPHVSTPGYEDD